ncbi:flavodoxin family protein [Nocardioides sambongensis]|uniref:flavodoxin family protein n=1 Tax=Nocardioides sambongensis TaxID=2589074 RepID=UPI001E44778C|nr:NAD(P)H-dependent oxidoreductase [Nocardioides sambongensis]
MARLLVVHHSPTRSLRTLTDAVVAGAGDEAIEGVEVVVRPALEATAEDVLAADGYLLGTSANFGYMSGALKHFFDSTFLAVGAPLTTPAAQAATAAGRPPGGRTGSGCTVATT